MATLLEVAQQRRPPREAGGMDASPDTRECAAGHASLVRPALRRSDRPKPCILIVDDDKAVRETLAELLEDEGFFCLTAGDAGAALTLLRQRAPIDALVTDLTMPGDDGIALIRLAREIDNRLPAILLTGYAEKVTSVSTIAGGKFHVLRKPVHCDRLIEQIDLLVFKPNG